MNIKRITILAIVAAHFSFAQAQKKYTDIFYALPNMTIEQQYADLSEYCRLDPYRADAHLQLAIVCESRMVHIDPLRNKDAAQFWAESALRHIQLFRKNYTVGDVKTNAEFYQNLKIAQPGKDVDETSLKNFLEQHTKVCSDFKTNSLEAYQLIKKSKKAYSAAIELFTSICKEYPTQEDALLYSDEQLVAKVKQLKEKANEATSTFQKYRKHIQAHPILNYRQLNELKPIVEYRIDGLTNSDFYQNRFPMWDYAAWADSYLKEYSARIHPFRLRMQAVYEAYAAEIVDLKSSKAPKAQSPADEAFTAQLNTADGHQLATEMFRYFELRSKLVKHCAAIQNTPQGAIFAAAKTAELRSAAEAKLAEAEKLINMQNVKRFASFYWKNFSGLEGLKKYRKAETTTLDNIVECQTKNLAGAMRQQQPDTKAFSQKTAKAAAVPLWAVDNNEKTSITGNYITLCVAKDNEGTINFVAGEKKGGKACFVAAIGSNNQTLWLKELPKTQSVKYAANINEGFLAVIVQNELPSAIIYDRTGKETARFSFSEGSPKTICNSQIDNSLLAVMNNDSQSATMCSYTAQGNRLFDVELQLVQQAEQIAQVADGTIVVGLNGDRLVATKVNTNGQGTPTSRSISKNIVRICATETVFAEKIGILCQDADGKVQFALLDKDCNTLYTTQK